MYGNGRQWTSDVAQGHHLARCTLGKPVIYNQDVQFPPYCIALMNLITVMRMSFLTQLAE